MVTCVRLACSATMTFAAEPMSVKFPATVLTHARINHAFVTLTPAVAAEEAASLGPRSNTVQRRASRLESVQILDLSPYKPCSNKEIRLLLYILITQD